jgi:hypothetical protein
MSVPRYQLATVDRGPSALLWGAKAVWDKLISTLEGSVAKDDFVPYTSQAVTEAPRGLLRGGPSNNTTDFALTDGEHGVVRVDYNTTAGDTVYASFQVEHVHDFSKSGESYFELLTTLNQDNEVLGDGGTIDFIGFSNVRDVLNTTDGIQKSTTITTDIAIGVFVSAAGVCSLIVKPAGSTAIFSVLKEITTITKGSAGGFHRIGVRVKRNGDGTYTVNACVDDVLASQAGIKTSADIDNAILKPTVASQTPGGGSGQVPALNVDWYASLRDKAVANVNG